MRKKVERRVEKGGGVAGEMKGTMVVWLVVGSRRLG